MVAQLPRLYVRGADVLAVQRPFEVEKRGVSIGVLHPPPLHQRLLNARIPPGHDKHLMERLSTGLRWWMRAGVGGEGADEGMREDGRGRRGVIFHPPIEYTPLP